jgi:hypothetical protein
MAKAKWREKSGQATKEAGQGSEAATATAAPETSRRTWLRTGGTGLRGGLKRVSSAAANLVGIIAMIICILLALHIAFVVFSANGANTIVHTVNDWADWFAWRFRDMFVPKDQRVGVLVNYGIAAAVYLIAGRIAAGLIRRIH